MGYKRYGSSTSVPTFDDDNNGEAVSNGILKNSSNKEIYFGIKKPKSAADSDKPWRELTTDDFDTQITSETGGCSATITKNDNDTTNKTGIIRYTLSKNTTGSNRVIRFNYKGTELFKINQDTDDNIYVYFRTWKVPVSYYEHYIVCTQKDFNIVFIHNLDSIPGAIINTNKTTDVVLYHVTNNKDISNIFLNKTIKTLISNNTLTYVTGKEFSNDENELIEAPIKIIHMYRNVQLQLGDVTDNSKMYVYGGRQDSTQGDKIGFDFLTNKLYNTIDWPNTNNDDDVRSIGKYKLNNIMHYTVIWDLHGGNINGNTSSIQDIVNHGDTVSFSKYKPVRTDYIFNGWSSDVTATSGSTAGNSAPITQYTTFFAIWKQLNKTVTFRFGNTTTNIVITWNDSSLPDVEFTIKIKDITNNSTFDVIIPKNYQSSGYTTNKTFISEHQYQLVSCSPTKVGNTTYQVFTGVTSGM